MEVLFNTVSSKDMMSFYLQSFIGKLGWLDASLTAWHYTAICTFLIFFVLLNIFSISKEKINYIARWSIASISLLSILAIFTALLISWTPHPATVVHGIQGRYFVVPFLLLAYAFHGIFDIHSRAFSMTKKLLLSVFFIFSAYALLTALQSRYPIH